MDDRPNPDYTTLIAVNNVKRRKAKHFILMVTGLAALAIFLLSSYGLSLNTYSEVSPLSSFADILGWIIALSGGVLSAYMTAHPVVLAGESGNKRDGSPTMIIVLVCVGLLLGVLPGLLVLAFYLLFRKKMVPEEVDQNKQDSTNRMPGLKPVHAFWVVLAFFVGLIPAGILAIIMTYPLSKHACELSGSKYC